MWSDVFYLMCEQLKCSREVKTEQDIPVAAVAERFCVCKIIGYIANPQTCAHQNNLQQ